MGGYYPGSVPVTGYIAPTHLADTFPTHKANFGQGGYKVVYDTAERDAITPERRTDGMMVYVLSPAVYRVTLRSLILIMVASCLTAGISLSMLISEISSS